MKIDNSLIGNINKINTPCFGRAQIYETVILSDQVDFDNDDIQPTLYSFELTTSNAQPHAKSYQWY